LVMFRWSQKAIDVRCFSQAGLAYPELFISMICGWKQRGIWIRYYCDLRITLKRNKLNNKIKSSMIYQLFWAPWLSSWWSSWLYLS
jgi:hypothetical protein